MAVVIPTLNEARYLPGLLSDLARVRVPAEVVVADGGSDDETVDRARAAGARVVRAPRGRGRQLNAGARVSRTPWICFLHADVRLNDAARGDLERTVRRGGVGAAVWRLRIVGRHPLYRLVELGAAIRQHLAGLPYGDQGLLVHRALFDAVGGFDEVEVMEDVGVVRRLRRRTRITRFASALQVSARRWEREGILRCTLRNAALLMAYRVGVAPSRLAAWYRPLPHD